MKSYQELLAKVQTLGADAAKVATGNKSAGVRLRAGMLEVKKLTTDVRNEVQTLVKGGE